MDAPGSRWTDDHERWSLYQRALDVPAAAELLHRCAAFEPDASVASALVVAALERVDRAERRRWVDVLNPAARAYAERRMTELGVLEDIRSGRLSTVDDVDGWSDWLQLRAAAVVLAPSVLAVLAERGRTKRIRRLAQDTLAQTGR